LAKIPNFTNASWQAQRSNGQLLASILDGKEEEMPSWKGKISSEQARGLVAYVRSFAAARGSSGQQEKADPGLAEFNERFRRLQGEMHALEKRSHKLLEASPGAAPPKGSVSGQPGLDRGSVPIGHRTAAAHELFLKRCVKCHEADGTGRKSRDRLAAIPDFTKAAWQARRSDAQLMASILDGKGDDMPSWRGKISQDQARALVAYVRSFVPSKGKPSHKEHDAPAPSGPMEAKSPMHSAAARLR
jgi:mono/diheme cytochrome c family protein